MMTVYAISDLHGHEPYITDCDLELFGGDYSPYRDEEKSKKYLDTVFRKYLEKSNARYKVGIAGNHDFAFQKDPEFARSLPWIYLENELVEIEGVKIYGTPYTPQFYNWAFMDHESGLKERYKDIPTGLDILLSHGPAYRRLDMNGTGVHCGSYSLLEKIREVKPNSVVSGHIHEGRGVMEEDGVRFYNVAYCDQFNSPKFNAVNIPLKWED